MQLQVLGFALLLVEHRLYGLKLPGAELLLLLVPLLFHLKALLKLTLCEGERVVFLLLGEDVRAEMINLASQTYNLLIFHRQVLLVLFDGCLVLLGWRVEHLLRIDRLLRSLLSDTDVPSVDSSLVHHLHLLCKRLLPQLMLHGLVHFRCMVAAVRQVDSIVDERLTCYVDSFIVGVSRVANDLRWIRLIILLQCAIF